MMVVLRSIFLLLVFISQSFGSWHPEKTHWPRTVIKSRADVELVKNKILAEPCKSIYDNVKITASLDYTGSGVNKAKICRAAAFCYLMEDDIRYADRAKTYLMETKREPYNNDAELIQNILWDSEILSLDCIAFDFLKANGYDFNGDEPGIREKIKSIAASLYYDLLVNSSWDNRLYWGWRLGSGERTNYGVKLASALGMAAIVLNDETGAQVHEQPQSWINYSMIKLHEQFNNYLVDEDGGWAEGPHYMEFSASNFIPFAIAHFNFMDGRTETYDTLALAPLLLDKQLRKNAEWGVRIRMPNGARPNFDDSFLNPHYFNSMLAGYLNDDVLAWDHRHADLPYFVGASSGNIDVEMICAYNENYPGEKKPNFPLTQFLIHSGQTIFRSDWGGDAVYMCLMGENGRALNGGFHEQFDATSFIIYGYGELLAMDSGYISWEKRGNVNLDLNHSLILVDGYAYRDSGYYSPTMAYAYFENYFDTKDFDYAEVSINYQKTDIRRCVSFINDSYFIISDFVSDSISHTYDWLLHGNGGGTTGNGFQLTEYGSEYTVNDVSLKLFLNASEGITFSNYNDYHDDGHYNVLAEHTVTKASVHGDSSVFTGFLIPTPTSSSLHYEPVNINGCAGGKILAENERTLALAKLNDSTVTTDFYGKAISFDGEILIASRTEDDLPLMVFLRQGKVITYDGHQLLESPNPLNIMLNISSNIVEGYINTAGQVDFYTGNEPTIIHGGTIDKFSKGVTTVIFPEPTYFLMQVGWRLSIAAPDSRNPEIFDYLFQNYPNPFNFSTIISYSIASAGFVTLKLYNLLGMEIQTLVNEFQNVGTHSIKFDARDLSSDIYLFKLKTKNFIDIKKMILLR